MFEKIWKDLLKINRIVDYLAIVGVFYILIYQIISLRNVCKLLCEYLADRFITIGLTKIRWIYFLLEEIFMTIIIEAIVLSIIIMLIRKICDKVEKRKTGDNRFEKSLFRYLRDSAVSRCFLITGKWGTGKSYDVNCFFEKYYKYSRVKVYRISCFGLSSRKELIDEINTIIEHEDFSLRAQFIKVIQYIPVIGDVLNKLLKKSYVYSAITQKSIFVFDDFERITAHSCPTSQFAQLYNPSPFLLNSKPGNKQIEQFVEIKKEFNNIKNSFSEIENLASKYILREDYEKYIAIVGLINELNESYKIKVIIVCNSDMLGEKFIHDVLRSKLNCLEYKKIITPEISKSVVNHLLSCKLSDGDDKKQNLIKSFFKRVKNIDVISNSLFRDLRLFCTFHEAFIDTALLFAEDMLTDDFLCSLMNSVLITHYYYYENNINYLEFFIHGGEMDFLFDLFGGGINKSCLVSINGTSEERRWVDVSISGYWILNLSVPNDIPRINIEWNKYKYHELEKNMIKNVECFVNANDYDYLHVLFYQKKKKENKVASWDCKMYINSALKEFDLSKIEIVNMVLNITQKAFCHRINEQFNNILFESLYEGDAEGMAYGDSYLHREYNKYLLSKKFIKDS